jgi:xylan 1,4-beta-xylosidase
MPRTARFALSAAVGLVGALLLVEALAASAHAEEPRFTEDGLCLMTVNPPRLVAPRADGEIAIDGALSEPAWQAAEASGGFTLVLEANTPAAQQTHVRALYDADNLYIGMVCEEPNVDQLVKRATEQGEYPSSDDRIEMLVGVPGSTDNYHEFAVSAGNIRYEAKARVWTEPFTFYTPTGIVQSTKADRELDTGWGAAWSSATAESEGRWTVEMAVPLESLGIDVDRDHLLRANFARVRVTYMPSPWGGRGRGGRSRMQPNVRPDHSAWSSPKGEMGTPALFGFIALVDENGHAPSTPATMEAAVPGMPGMPGAPNDETAPDRVRFTVDAGGPAHPLRRFWDGLGGSQLSPLDDGVFARTFATGLYTKVRLDRPWPRNATLVDGKLEGDMSRLNQVFDKVKERDLTALDTIWYVPQEIEYAQPGGGRQGGPLADDGDYQVIYNYYRAYFEYLSDRYGTEFFNTIRFEFWNEPDWPGKFFGGTVDDYFKWYAWVAKALKDVSTDGKIGGPAVTGGGFDFTRAFLERCRSADNPATGGKGAPVDFVSFHTYGWRAQLTPYASQDALLTIVRFWRIMKDTGFGGTETFVSEFGVEPTGSAGGEYFWFRRTHYAPVWMARFVKQVDDAAHTYADLGARMDGALIHLGAAVDSPAFYGKRSLFTDKYVPKPYFNGYVLLNELGGERLPADGPASQDIACMPTRRTDGSLAILVFHFKEYQKTSPPEMDTVFELAGLPTEGVKISQMRVDENTSNSYTAWVKMGSPEEITDDIAARLTAAAEVHKTPLKANDAGLVELNMPVNSVAVVLVEKDRPAQTAPAAPAPTTETAPAE